MQGIQDTPTAPTATTTSPAPLTADGVPPQRGFLVGTIVVCVSLAVAVMVGFIWYHPLGVREPTTAIIIDGDETFDGTVVNVLGPRKIIVTLNKANNYHAPVLVEPGHYLVVAERNGLPIIRTEVDVKRFLGIRIDLPDYVKRAGLAAGAGEPEAHPSLPPPDTNPTQPAPAEIP